MKIKYAVLVCIVVALGCISCSSQENQSNVKQSSNGGNNGGTYPSGPVTMVSPGQGLTEAIKRARPGDIIELEAGNYGYSDLSYDGLTDVRFDDYILIRKKPGAGPVIFNAYYFNIRMVNCSHIIFDGIIFENGGIGIQLWESDHIIFNNCEIRNQEQEGFQVQHNSSYVDFLNGKIRNTGATTPKWGEGIYIGTAGQYDGKYDHTHRIWIENTEIYSCGNGEAVNFKGDVMDSTIRGCTIHTISPGTYDQINEGAVSLEAPMDTANLTRRNNFVENNTITDVSGGFVGNASGGYNNADFNNGIAIFGAGNTFQNNTISNCTHAGIFGNTYANQGSLANYVYNNTISNCTVATEIHSGLTIVESPNPNPFSRQLEMP